MITPADGPLLTCTSTYNEYQPSVAAQCSPEHVHETDTNGKENVQMKLITHTQSETTEPTCFTPSNIDTDNVGECSKVRDGDDLSGSTQTHNSIVQYKCERCLKGV